MNKRAKGMGAKGRVRAFELEHFYARVQNCHWCRCEVDFNERHDHGRAPNMATLDHVIAMSRGGSNAIENLVVSCGACNSLREMIESYTGSRKSTKGISSRAGMWRKNIVLPYLFKSCNRDYWEFRARQIDISKSIWYTPPCGCNLSNEGHLSWCSKYMSLKLKRKPKRATTMTDDYLGIA